MEALEKQVMFDNNDCDDIFMTYELFHHCHCHCLCENVCHFLMATAFFFFFLRGGGGGGLFVPGLATCSSFECAVRGALSLPSVLP